MKRFNITVNGHAYDVQVEEVSAAAATVPAAPAAVPAPAPVPAPVPSAPEAGGEVTPSATEGAETIEAPMPGTIVNVLVHVGDKVEKGQVLLLLEAMKMENEIMAPHDAVVAGIHVAKGDSVNSGTLLVSLR